MKRISILGTGIVGTTIGSKLIELGYEVMIGSRSEDNSPAIAWANSQGEKAKHGTFAMSASFGEIVFNCTKGDKSLQALQLAGHENLQGKILVDLANALDFSHGMPPTLLIPNTDSLGERIQRQFPDVKVVKALNTINCKIMVNPNSLRDQGTIFIAGNDINSKAEISELLRSFGWNNILDLGSIQSARSIEQLLPIWGSVMNALGTSAFNFKIVL